MASSAVTKQSYCNSHVILISLAFFSVAKTCFVEKFEPQMGSGDDFIKLHVRLQGMILPYVTRQSGYANTIQDNPTQLTNASLSETLKCAESTLNMVKKLLERRELRPREAGAIKDCVETMKDSVDELRSHC
jgi:hypothetical protein